MSSPTLMYVRTAGTIPGVIAANQASCNDQPYFIADGVRVWSARLPGSEGGYLVMFNTDKIWRSVKLRFNMINLNGPVGVRYHQALRVLEKASATPVTRSLSHGAALCRLRRRGNVLRGVGEVTRALTPIQF